MRTSIPTRLGHALIALVIAAAATTAVAQDRPRQQGRAAGEQPQQQQQQRPPLGDGVLRLLPADSVTEHTVDIAGGKLAYTATAGTLDLFDQSGERTAKIFYTAYIAKAAEAESRPITFAFNGGPGAASAYLNLGLVGPRIAEFGGGNQDGSSTRLKDNPDTWLAFTDLVLIDPVGTGWSKPAKPDGGQAFWGVTRDAQAMAKTIALYVSKNSRGPSPKFLLGESYGGFRAAKVARALQRDQGIAVGGIIMVSPMLEGAFQFGGTRFALGAALQLPSLAAAELDRKGQFTPEKLAEAEHFAINEYLPMLAGPAPKGEAARAVYAKIAQMTGLPEEVIARPRGFIRDAYVKNLRSSQHQIVSRYDATYAANDPYPEQENARGPDPLLDGVTRAYGGTFVTYARDELRLQDRDDLRAPCQRCFRQVGLGRGRRPQRRERRRRPALPPLAHPVIPAADRPRLRGPGDALRNEPLRARPSSADRRSRADGTQALSRRAHVLSRRHVAASIHRRGQSVLSGAVRRLPQNLPAHRRPGERGPPSPPCSPRTIEGIDYL